MYTRMHTHTPNSHKQGIARLLTGKATAQVLKTVHRGKLLDRHGAERRLLVHMTYLTDGVDTDLVKYYVLVLALDAEPAAAG